MLGQHSEERSFAVIDRVLGRPFNPKVHRQLTECCIDFEKFKPDDEVTVLPCNKGHYFHTKCLLKWF